MPRHFVWLALLPLLAIGCKRQDTPVPDIAIEMPQVIEKEVEGPNAFESYARLAERAKQAASVSLDVRDTDGTRRKVLAEMGPLLQELAQATSQSCAFHYTVVEPYEPKPHHIGWLQLGRALGYRIDQAVQDEEFAAAAQWAVVAITFGADLCAGDVSDAALGLGIIDTARRAIAPHIARLSPEALTNFAAGTERALQRMADPTTTIQNENVRMTVAVRALQKGGDFSTWLYKDSREAAERFAEKTPVDRNAFLQALIDEQARVVAQLGQAAMVPGAKRGPIELTLSGDERRIAQQFFTAGGPWLAVRDQTLARTRLLYCNARLLSLAMAPGDLDDLDPVLRTDPYTGMEFGYLPLGREFLVYSYGIDGKDDRGDTDSARTAPDLLLE